MQKNCRIILMFCLILAMTVMTACSNSDNSSGNDETKGTSGGGDVNNNDEEKPVTINYWVDPRFKLIEGMKGETKEFGDYEKIQAEKFMDEHPNVTINVQVVTFEDLPKKVPVAIKGGNPPDILRDFIGRTAQYAHQGVLENMEDLIPEKELDKYLDDYIDMSTVDGELHALPIYSWVQAAVINKSLWKDAGKEDLLPPEDDPVWSVDQFKEALKAIKDENVYPAGIQVSEAQSDYGLLSWFWGHGAKLYEDDDHSKTALNSSEGVKALKDLVELKDEDLLVPSVVSAGNEDMDTYMNKGQLGIRFPAGATQWDKIRRAEEEGKAEGDHDLMFVKEPDVDGVESGVSVGPTELAVFKQDDEYKKKMIGEFVKFLGNPEHQEVYSTTAGQLPTRKDVKIEDQPDYMRYTQEIMEEYGTEDMGVTTEHYSEVRELLAPLVQNAMLGKITPEEALDKYEKQANEILED